MSPLIRHAAPSDSLAPAFGAPSDPGPRSCAPIISYVGIATMFIGMAALIPLALLPFYPSETTLAPCFIFPGLIAMAAGYLMRFAVPTPSHAFRLSKGQAAVCTLLIWVIAIAVYAAPFVLAGMLTIPQAVYESTSGLTTTGLSVVDVDSCPQVLLFHRSLTCYLGGVGLVLILTCVITPSGGLGVYNAEGHTDRLLPGTAKTARMILLIYTGIIAAGVLAYCAAGMSLFDAVNISMCAVSTAGFATHAESIAFWASPTIEAITIVLMLAGGLNFLALFLLLQGKVRAFLTHVETPVYFGIVAIGSLVVAGFFLAQGVSENALEALRDALFQVSSVLTSTGFQTIPSFVDLGAALMFLFMLLMFIGAEARSTSGGIKVYRIVVAARGLGHGLRQRYGSKRRITSIKINRFGKRSVLSTDDIEEAQTFVVIYVLVFIVGTFLFILCGATLQEAAFDFASCLGNTGVGTGFLGPTTGDAALDIASLGMLLGRLEIIPLFMGARTLIEMVAKRRRHGHR